MEGQLGEQRQPVEIKERAEPRTLAEAGTEMAKLAEGGFDAQLTPEHFPEVPKDLLLQCRIGALVTRAHNLRGWAGSAGATDETVASWVNQTSRASYGTSEIISRRRRTYN